MKKIDWARHQQQFDARRIQEGQTLISYCREMGLNLNTARKRLRISDLPSQANAAETPPTTTPTAPDPFMEMVTGFDVPDMRRLPPDIRRRLNLMNVDIGNAKRRDLEEAMDAYKSDYQLHRNAVKSYEGMIKPDDPAYIAPLMDEKGKPVKPSGAMVKLAKDNVYTTSEGVRTLAQDYEKRQKAYAFWLKTERELLKQHRELLREELREQLLFRILGMMRREENALNPVDAVRIIELRGYNVPELLSREAALYMAAGVDGRNDPEMTEEELDAAAVQAAQQSQEWEREIADRVKQLERQRAEQVQRDSMDNDLTEEQRQAGTPEGLNPDNIDYEASDLPQVDIDIITAEDR